MSHAASTVRGRSSCHKRRNMFVKPMSAFARPAVLPAHRLRKRVVGPMRERVTVDDEQRSQATRCSSALTASASRSVAIRAASPVGRSARSSTWIGAPYATRSGPSRASRSVPAMPAGTSGTLRLERDTRSARAPACLVLLPQAFPAPGPFREHHDRLAIAERARPPSRSPPRPALRAEPGRRLPP